MRRRIIRFAGFLLTGLAMAASSPYATAWADTVYTTCAPHVTTPCTLPTGTVNIISSSPLLPGGHGPPGMFFGDADDPGLGISNTLIGADGLGGTPATFTTLTAEQDFSTVSGLATIGDLTATLTCGAIGTGDTGNATFDTSAGNITFNLADCGQVTGTTLAELEASATTLTQTITFAPTSTLDVSISMSANAPAGEALGITGFTEQFSLVTIPEPTTLSLLGLGTGILAPLGAGRILRSIWSKT